MNEYNSRQSRLTFPKRSIHDRQMTFLVFSQKKMVFTKVGFEILMSHYFCASVVNNSDKPLLTLKCTHYLRTSLRKLDGLNVSYAENYWDMFIIYFDVWKTGSRETSPRRRINPRSSLGKDI